MTDPDPDPGGPKHRYGFRSTTLPKKDPEMDQVAPIKLGNRVRIRTIQGNPFLISVSDPDSLIPDKDPAFRLNTHQDLDSGFWWPIIDKIYC